MTTFDPAQFPRTPMGEFFQQCSERYGAPTKTYMDFWRWTIAHKSNFWSGVVDWAGIDLRGGDSSTPVACDDFFPYRWFPGRELNFARELLSRGHDQDVAVVALSEGHSAREVTYQQLRSLAGGFAASLDLKKSEVVAAYMPNTEHIICSMLGATSRGAVFTSTSCDFGVEGVVQRFGQSRPRVLVCVNGYFYNGKGISITGRIEEVCSRVNSIQDVVVVDYLGTGEMPTLPNQKIHRFEELGTKELVYEDVPFDHPCYILYSSGTTGKPKCIVHGTGGTLVQHVKELGLHCGLKREEAIFYFTTCGWMMWNWLVSSLFFGSKVILYEGSPGHPGLNEFLTKVYEQKPAIFGTSPKFLRALESTGLGVEAPESLRLVLSTGAPLLPDQFDYIDSTFAPGRQIGSICGGTDIVSCFMLANPANPVKRGKIQGPGLGMDVSCVDSNGNTVNGSEGELVCLSSFPSRPVHFLDDDGDVRFRKAYFEEISIDGKTIWHHGDFISMDDEGHIEVFGRSDATLNPGGVRIGTAEIYKQTETVEGIDDAICVGKQVDGDVDVWLFVKLKSDVALTDELVSSIKTRIRAENTPRHVPKVILQVSDIPYTRSGKKMELAVTRLINGRELDNVEAVANPSSLEQYKNV